MQVLGWDKETQTGAFTDSFDDQSLGLQQAQQFIAQGADIIMPVAGPVGMGAAAAAKADGKTLIVGVDSDWYETNPQYSSIILTSVMKEIGAAVEQAIRIRSRGSSPRSTTSVRSLMVACRLLPSMITKPRFPRNCGRI